MRKTICVNVLSLCLLTIISCSKSEAPKPFDKITVQLKWVHQVQFAGLYVAQEKGYFAEEKIDVDFKEGGPKINILEEVASGIAQFGISSPELLIKTRLSVGNACAIAVIFRRNPMVFFSMKGSNIKRPTDFMNRSLTVPPDEMYQLIAVMNRLGLDMDNINILPHDYGYKLFIGGEAEVSGGYINGGATRLINAGHKLNIIFPSDYGVHLYSDTLFTTDKLIKDNPDLVLRFLRATLKGWRYAVENPEDAVETSMKYVKEKDRELQRKMFEAQLPLIHTGEDQIGWMRPEIWEGMHKLLLEQEVIAEPVDLEKVYTTKFLEDIYEKMM